MALEAILIQIVMLCCASGVLTVNNRPVIGVFFQESHKDDIHGDTYLMSDYVGFLQSAGAMVVPIRVKESDQYYEDMFRKINGVLLPGGRVDLITSEYAKAGRKMFNLTIEAKKKGDYFPMWGTCLGSELLVQMAIGNSMVYTDCEAEDLHVPLHLLPDAKESKVLRSMPENDLYVLTHYNVTANFHHECLTPKAYGQNEKLKAFYKPVSINYDVNGTEFISLFEARDYPMYGSQFHPEKNMLLWKLDQHTNHSFGAIKVSQYFANFFVNEARKSNHRYPDNETLSKDLFYNYNPVYLGYPSMYSNYYLNFSAKDDSEFEAQWKGLMGDGFFSMWKREKLNTSYMLCSVVVFFLMGISFVFVMDYVITMSGKLFSLTKDVPNDIVYEDEDNDVKAKLLENEYFEQKVPLRDGPEL